MSKPGMLGLKSDGEAVLLPVKVSPGASRTRIMGIHDGRLKIAVSAAPEKGRANDELVAFLADVLGIRSRDLTVQSGSTSRQKTIRIEGVSQQAVLAALGPARS
jgi:hypothetical protein